LTGPIIVRQFQQQHNRAQQQYLR